MQTQSQADIDPLSVHLIFHNVKDVDKEVICSCEQFGQVLFAYRIEFSSNYLVQMRNPADALRVMTTLNQQEQKKHNIILGSMPKIAVWIGNLPRNLSQFQKKEEEKKRGEG